MDLRYLRYFVVVAEEMNFTRAAERLHTAQPSLSVQIRRLEQEVGALLFAREGRGVTLTDAGRVFLERARKMLVDVERGMALARQAANGEVGHLSIGYDAAAEFRVFPHIVPAFRQKWPGIHLSFHSLKNSQQLEGLRRDQLDVGFVFLPVPKDEFDVEELVKVPLVVALPANHRLACASTVSIKELSHEPLILFPRALDPETYNEIEKLFTAAGAAMNVVVETAIFLSGINFVSLGIGCSFLGEYARRVKWPGVVYKTLEPAKLVKSVAIIKKQRSSDLVEAFYRFTVESIRATTAPLPQSATSPARRRKNSHAAHAAALRSLRR
jgi:DNA-binding transcriptional LysR family regulator